MNRFTVLASALAVLALTVVSCDEVEQPTYSGYFYRFATVASEGGSAHLDIDYTNEVFSCKNFSSIDDFKKFNTRSGQRGLAKLNVEMIGNASNCTFELVSFDSIEASALDPLPENFQDTLGTYFHYEQLQIDGSFSYPRLWANGHFINTKVTYYPNPDCSTPSEFYFYPIDVRGDTLQIDIIASVPESDYSYEAQGAFYCKDLSTMRSQAETDAHVADLLQAMEALGTDSITIELASCDSVEIYNNGAYRRIEGANNYTRILFDF